MPDLLLYSFYLIRFSEKRRTTVTYHITTVFRDEETRLQKVRDMCQTL